MSVSRTPIAPGAESPTSAPASVAGHGPRRAEARRIERFYGAVAGLYDGMFDWALAPGRRRALAALAPTRGQRILEIGVGTGLSLPHYPPGCDVVGVDVSEAMLERARARLAGLERPGIRLRRMDATRLRFDDGAFDGVFAPYVISVVPDPERVLRECARVCRPGGTVVVVNHFRSESSLLGAVERASTPASRLVGFRLDLPVSTVTSTPGLDPVGEERVNLFGLWRVLTLRRA